MSISKTKYKIRTRDWSCLWDGVILNLNSDRRRTDRRQFCKLPCNRSHYLFTRRLQELDQENKIEFNFNGYKMILFKDLDLQYFIQYCYREMLKRIPNSTKLQTPTKILYDQFRLFKREKITLEQLQEETRQ